MESGMMRELPAIRIPTCGYLVKEAFPVTRTRICFPRQLHCYQAESGDILIDVVEKFPDPPGKEAPGLVSAVSISPSSMKLKAMARVSDIGSDGKLPPNVLYLLDLGVDIDQIKSMTRRFPAFAYCSLEGKIKPLVEFLLELGVNRSDIPSILNKRPQLCAISLSENLIPTMTYLESLGVDNEKWAKVIYRFPALLTYSRQKLNTTVDYLYELGVTAENVGNILTRCPHIISYSVDEKLRPTAQYFRSMGVDVAVLVHRAPYVFGLNIERNLKPITEFFLEKGYSIEEVGTMVSRNGNLYAYSLVENIIPKWEFFLTMHYPMSELVKFPKYFCCSLEKRIKPRYALVRESGVTLNLNQTLTVAEPKFMENLNNKVKKRLDKLGTSQILTSDSSLPALSSLKKEKKCNIVDADDFQTASEVKKKTKKTKKTKATESLVSS